MVCIGWDWINGMFPSSSFVPPAGQELHESPQTEERSPLNSDLSGSLRKSQPSRCFASYATLVDRPPISLCHVPSEQAVPNPTSHALLREGRGIRNCGVCRWWSDVWRGSSFDATVAFLQFVSVEPQHLVTLISIALTHLSLKIQLSHFLTRCDTILSLVPLFFASFS
ncbi:hypothetical protein CCUS01_13809 [Colletotrichum cuscutae]|uniref:Uncharacterized protein n=1 Tax=Colletotrichum cuscutae TaxID=1209917 RepID=A0AAJ0DMX9_9PEZI|nr:hypothetical protein CCUS01_13809 [Colletotrichum cuscutae]